MKGEEPRRPQADPAGHPYPREKGHEAEIGHRIAAGALVRALDDVLPPAPAAAVAPPAAAP